MIIIGIDLETTGFDPKKDRIVSVGACALDSAGREIGSMTMLCNPGIPIPPEATAVHGITDEMVQLLPSWQLAVSALDTFVHNACVDVVYAYSGTFDEKFLMQAYESQLYYCVDIRGVLNTVKKNLPDLPNHKLATVAEHLDLPRPDHTALGDARCVAHLAHRMML